MKLRRTTLFFLLVSALCTLTGCENKPAGSVPSEVTDGTATKPARLEFNTSDKVIGSNNNIAVAAARIMNEETGSLFNSAEQVSAATLTKSPYSSIGKVYKITGEVYKVEELPPTDGLKGTWGEILMMVGNKNSPMGLTTVDFLYNGDISKVNSGDVITCSGYFTGTFESENAMGGKVEAVVLVGNSVKHK